MSLATIGLERSTELFVWRPFGLPCEATVLWCLSVTVAVWALCWLTHNFDVWSMASPECMKLKIWLHPLSYYRHIWSSSEGDAIRAGCQLQARKTMMLLHCSTLFVDVRTRAVKHRTMLNGRADNHAKEKYDLVINNALWWRSYFSLRWGVMRGVIVWCIGLWNMLAVVWVIIVYENIFITIFIFLCEWLCLVATCVILGPK